MKFWEPVDLGDNWVAVKRPTLNEKGTIVIKHRCEGTAAIANIQKNTHRRHGVRWRCHDCKTYAPKRVIVFMKLHKISERVN